MTNHGETRGADSRHRRPIRSDRFDRVPKLSRVGAHRAVERPGSPGLRVLIAALAAIILTLVGVLIITLQPGSVSFMDQLVRDDAGEVDQAAVVASEVNPATSIVVLNGTPHENLALIVDEIIVDEEWGATLFSGDAEDRDVQISAIFYSDPADIGLAKGLGENLGGISYYESDQFASYGNQLTVLLGADYAGPGSEGLSAE